MIDVQGLDFTYPGSSVVAVSDISFSIGQGEIFGFLGPSGAGKSTTQKILIGLLKGYSGSVKVLGEEIRAIKGNFYERIGVSFELPNLYSRLTALENLSLFSSLYQSQTMDLQELLSLVGLADDSRTLVSAYSKGMKMRLSFCRALLNNPDLLFLDEPTSGLDPSNAQLIKNIILDRKRAGRTIFLTTHNMQIAEELCDRVAFMVDGKIVMTDSPRALKQRFGKREVRVEYFENDRLHSDMFALETLGSNQSFLSILGSNRIETIHTQEATLEDVFLKVTGRALS